MTLTPWEVMNGYTFVLLIILATINFKGVINNERTVKYRRLLFFIGVLLISDTISRCDALMPTAPWLVKLGNFMIFAFDPLGLFFAVSYEDSWIEGGRDEKFLKIYNYALLIFAFINILVNVIQIILKINIFYLYDENNVYHRGPFFLLRGILIFIFLILLAVYSVVMRKHIDRHYRPALMMFPFIVFIGGLLQIVFAGIQFEYAGMTIGCLLIYLFLQSKDTNVDYLTNAMNRRSLDGVLQSKIKTGKNFSGIMIDIDYFKKINDTYGHAVGDDALQPAAHILRQAFLNRRDANIFRFGGDEFCIITDDADEEALKETVSSIKEKLTFYNGKHRIPVALSFSIGQAVYVGKSGLSQDDFMKSIDSVMYFDKQKNHRDFDRRKSS